MTDKSLLFLHEPRWQPLSYRFNTPADVSDWLLEPGSITARLRARLLRPLTVKVLNQSWQRPLFSEHRLMKLNAQHRHLVREVLLETETGTWVIARTVIPRTTLSGVCRSLNHVGSRPLGEVLFADPYLQRQQLEFCRIHPDHWQTRLRSRLSLEQPVWGRRTVYLLAKKPILICEFFLPELLKF